MVPRFLQIHTLSPYTSVLLNRDDTGLAKRLPYGGVLRTRISSQCLKRAWRLADDPHSLNRIDGSQPAFRSRELVTHKVIAPLRNRFSEDVIDVIEPEFQQAIYGKKGTTKKGRQTLLFGQPELDWLAKEAMVLAEQANGNPELASTLTTEWKEKFKANINTMRNTVKLPGGLTSALFGRMVTSDTDANITASIHVAHAFTVHAEEAENDYFTAMDDLSLDEPGADTIQETELTSGLFYGYVVVDIPGLVKNLGRDVDLAGKVLFNLIHLVTEVTPGAKLGSTAPYGRASLLLLEAGDRQPRSLAEAFRRPCEPETSAAIGSLSRYLEQLDKAYDTGEERYVMTTEDIKLPRTQRNSLVGLAAWAKSLPGANQ